MAELDHFHDATVTTLSRRLALLLLLPTLHGADALPTVRSKKRDS
jgi:hypothetical protein